jgi:N-methylhydantoinase A/oxoprolinase/acetone carboxylase beta subunit
MENLLSRGENALGLTARLRDPVIGIGAPVHYFLPRAGRLLNAEVIVPHDADVANAVGAITSNIIVAQTARIQPNEMGHYAVEGLPGAPTFPDIEDAHRYARKELERSVRERARRAGTSQTRVQTRTRDRITPAADGSEVFIERVVSARLSGAPDAVEARPAGSGSREPA